MAELSSRRPELQFVITTTTQTGYALAQKKYAQHVVSYCPLDFSWAVKAALCRLRPDLLVLAELELWPNLIVAARRHDIPVVVVNGRLSAASHRGYQRIRWAIAPVLRQLTAVAVQNRDYADRFVNLGTPRNKVTVTGSIKFDNAKTDRENPQTLSLRNLVGLGSDQTVFLAGSTQEPEESLTLKTYAQLQARYPHLRLVVVPRHPERFDEVHQLLAAGGLQYLRRSQIDCPVSAADWQVLLVDTVGELGAWWGVADIAFVGGSMGTRGGQNMIEPAAYGAAVCFGTNTRNFRDVVSMLLAVNAAVVVRDGGVLSQFVSRCLDEPQFARRLGERAQSLVVRQRGATARTVDILEKFLPGPSLNKFSSRAISS
jgi:3-deoxy-D-manno-octulosonic-acid transferase